MARSCPVCKRGDVDDINRKIMEGLGSQTIKEQHHGTTVNEIANHRSAGHAAKALTAMVLRAGEGPVGDLAKIEIARKGWRLEKLHNIFMRLEQEIAKADVGSLDPRIATAAAMMLQQAAKEMGEWRPDGGEKAEATAQLAQSIVIHAAVQGKALGYSQQTIQSTYTVESTSDKSIGVPTPARRASAIDSAKSSESGTTE